jgi:hypothetical protein
MINSIGINMFTSAMEVDHETTTTQQQKCHGCNADSIGMHRMYYSPVSQLLRTTQPQQRANCRLNVVLLNSTKFAYQCNV